MKTYMDVEEAKSIGLIDEIVKPLIVFASLCRLSHPRKWRELYAQHCGKTKEYIERMFDMKTYMDAKKAKSIGLVDEIFKSP